MKLNKEISDRFDKKFRDKYGKNTNSYLFDATPNDIEEIKAFLAEELANQKKEMIERIGSNQELLIKVEELINKAIDKLKLTGDPSVISSVAILILDDIIQALR